MAAAASSRVIGKKLGLREIHIGLMPAFTGQLECEGLHPARLCGAEEGVPWPAHSNLLMFGGTAQALGLPRFWPAT
ncbi:hypothetical protein U0070_008845 [Myodes glareolus]|uniref:Uncharacterized protein n=1 Tax=Myodes glareolus TaxID=447135 RepID=A0AAW0IJA9_MYOGA